MMIGLDAFVLDMRKALVQLRERIDALERQTAALAPLLDSDRLEVARVCQKIGVALKDLHGRVATEERAQAANHVFKALRQSEWSFDRIGRATGYSARGIASNLERFASGISGNAANL